MDAGTAAAIPTGFAELDVNPVRREAAQIGNFAMLEEAALQRNMVLGQPEQLVEGSGDDEVVRVVDARIAVEAENTAEELAKMQQFLADVDAIRAEFGLRQAGDENDREEDQE